MISNDKKQIGSRVRITKDIPMFTQTFKAGHEFVIYGAGERGWNLIDKNGLKLDETAMINKYIELIDETNH